MNIFDKVLLLFLFLPLTSYTQCDGNLGENIFLDGDFGSGANNILQINPNIAPGYIYSTFPPPNDGEYTITNNTTSWGSFATNWANIQDNSNDPLGYMMVVNASFDTGLFYEQQVTGLCENTEYVFSVDIINLVTGVGSILPNVSFLLDGQVVYETGDVPTTGTWNTYGFTFATEPGQSTLTLALQNNAPGGSGNDLALDNISFRACGPLAQILPDEVENICEDGDPITIAATITGDQYPDPSLQWQQSFDEGATWEDLPGETGVTFTHTEKVAGFYYYRYLLANTDVNLLNDKCRVNSNIKIVRVEPKFYEINDTICEGVFYEVDGVIVTESGTFIDDLTSTNGCDSIVTKNVTVLDDPDLQLDILETNPNCENVSDGTIEVTSVSNGYEPYQVYIDDVNYNPWILENLDGGIYTVRVSDRYGCSTESEVTIVDPPVFTLDVGDDVTVDLGEQVVISPITSEPIANFTVEPDGVAMCNSDCSELQYLPTESGLISFTATSEAGCIATDDLLVTVIKVRNVFFPNVFSPNGDGVNDEVRVVAKYPNVSSVLEFSVYDRWGQLVSSRRDYNPEDGTAYWDGTFDGQLVSNGVYSYIIRVQFLDGVEETYLGTITVLR